MNVNELIERLSKIEKKEKNVFLTGTGESLAIIEFDHGIYLYAKPNMIETRGEK